jgi:hypothetical protein
LRLCDRTKSSDDHDASRNQFDRNIHTALISRNAQKGNGGFPNFNPNYFREFRPVMKRRARPWEEANAPSRHARGVPIKKAAHLRCDGEVGHSMMQSIMLL